MMTMCFFVSRFPTACIDQLNVTADQFNQASLTNRSGSNSIWTLMDLLWILFVCVIFSGINLYHREMGSSIRLRFGVGRVLYNVAIHTVHGLERSRSRVIAQTPEKIVALDMELKVKKQTTSKRRKCRNGIIGQNRPKAGPARSSSQKPSSPRESGICDSRHCHNDINTWLLIGLIHFFSSNLFRGKTPIRWLSLINRPRRIMLRANCNYFASVYSISLRASRVAGATARSRGFGSSVARNKQNLVILGSGWGGYEVLRGVDKKRWGEPAFYI